MASSSRALFRSWPNGFSMTTRRHWLGAGRGQAGAASCSQTTEKNFGGIDR